MAEGSGSIPRGPAAPPRANFQADVLLSSEDEGIRQRHEEACCSHPSASYGRGKSLPAARVPPRRLPGDGEDGGAAEGSLAGRLRRGLPASFARNLFFLLPPALPPRRYVVLAALPNC